MPNIMLEDIMQQFDIGAATFGQFSGFYYIGYSLMHLPIGIMLDRYGPKKIMTGCILLTVIGLMPLIFAEHWFYPILGRTLVGMGSSAAILGVFKIVRMTFSEERFPRMLSFSVMIGLLGAIYGGGPLSYMRETLGYTAVIELFAAGGVALAFLTYWIVPDIKEPPKSTVIADVKEVLSNGRVIWSCIFAGLMVGPMEGFADVWSTVFLKQVYHFEGTVSASLPSMIFIGMCFGAPLMSFIAEKIGSYLTTIIIAGIVMVGIFSYLLAWQQTPETVSFYFALIGVCCAYQILAIYKASTYVNENVAGLTTAIANMIIMFFGYAFHTAIGGVVNAMGGPTTSEALVFGVAVVPVALCIGIAGFLFLSSMEKANKAKMEVVQSQAID
jgi:predicted MFS family arabinose efflux permease